MLRPKLSSNNLYESFKETLTRGLNDKYRYLRHNTDIYQDYPFRIDQISEPSTKHDENGRLTEPHLNGFGFTATGGTLITNMLLRYQNETYYVQVNLNNRTFHLTPFEVRCLKERDPGLR